MSPSFERSASSAWVSKFNVALRMVRGSILSSSLRERKLNANIRDPVCAGVATFKASGPLVSGTGVWCERLNQLHTSLIAHKLQSYCSQPENRKYLPSAVHVPEDCRQIGNVNG